MAEKVWMELLAAFDDEAELNSQECMDVFTGALNDYAARILTVVNGAPMADRPLVIAALRLTYEACKSTDPYLRAAVAAIEALPVAALTTTNKRRKRAGEDPSASLRSAQDDTEGGNGNG